MTDLGKYLLMMLIIAAGSAAVCQPVALAGDMAVSEPDIVISGNIIAPTDDVTIFQGATITLDSDSSVTGIPSTVKTLYILEGATLNLSEGHNLITDGDLLLEGGPDGADTTVNLAGNSRITVNGIGADEEG
jgi:hypothetical protein